MNTSIKKLLILPIALLAVSSLANAADYGDRNCNIFVSEAGNVITGGYGNFLSATVVVSKDLIGRHFRNYEVKILGSENVKPTRVEDHGATLAFVFDKYARGVEYKYNTASVVAYITNGYDRLFDNNDNVWLVPAHNWQYTNQRCR